MLPVFVCTIRLDSQGGCLTPESKYAIGAMVEPAPLASRRSRAGLVSIHGPNYLLNDWLYAEKFLSAGRTGYPSLFDLSGSRRGRSLYNQARAIWTFEEDAFFCGPL